MTYLLVFIFFLFASCSSDRANNAGISIQHEIRVDPSATSGDILNANGTLVKTRINPPGDYKRIHVDSLSFAHYLRNLPVKAHESPVYLYNGSRKNRQDVHFAIVDMDVGNRDLQQCADAVMRLRAEYLFQAGLYDKIEFHFTNGFLADYDKWKEGFRIRVDGNQVRWVNNGNSSENYESFREYLKMVFIYAGTLSLEREMKVVDVSEAEPGDVFIQGGSPGHAIIIVDMCESSKGEKLMLLAQSYMPAQEIHILKNPQNSEQNPWYKLDFDSVLVTPEWTFEKNDLRRF